MENYPAKGYNIFMDNFFTSISLAKYLFKQKTYITEMIRRNRKSLPKKFMDKFVAEETKYFKTQFLQLALEKRNHNRRRISSSESITLENSNRENIFDVHKETGKRYLNLMITHQKIIMNLKNKNLPQSEQPGYDLC
ncbi:hypothetical protein HZH68_014851 [Vespula germanica]|uniref:PiggyBac transposable element-derived protein domain-containing protein n=1 Tax=Vespula germanica TaxID=30212 RepID=A0A834MUF1_VESGE|nr:hypothetical protein HZH68_014851 [Vespula germanica]